MKTAIIAAMMLSMSAIARAEPEGVTPAAKSVEPLAGQWELVGEAVSEPGWDMWGSSPVRDDEGKVHLFCARWPSDTDFNAGWRMHSEIAHYVAEGPEGPFQYVSTVGKGDGEGWAARAWHNPSIRRIDNRYVLVFIANDGIGRHGPNQRIGMMVADTLYGPWKRIPDANTPLLSPPEDPGIWCHQSLCGVVNPSLLQLPNGTFHLYFKARTERVTMGVAIADRLEGPYVIHKSPITANTRTIEDGYAFLWRGHVCLMTTDNHGMLEKGGGMLWVSRDGIHFDPQPLPGFHHLKSHYLKGRVPANAVHRYGTEVKFERPQLLVGEDGEPEYLYGPSGSALDGSDGTNVHVLRRKKEQQE